jgi:hypothetical protein
MSDAGTSFVLRRFPPWSMPALGVPTLCLAVGAAAEGHVVAAAGLAAIVAPMLWLLTGAAVLTLDRLAGVLRVTARGAALGTTPQEVPLDALRAARAEPIEDSESLALVVDVRGQPVRLCTGDPQRVVEAAAWILAARQVPGRKSSAAASD